MIETDPSPEALAWAASTAGPAATVRSVRPLAGGMHAAAHLIETRDPHAEMVLRRFVPTDETAGHERRVLGALTGLIGPGGLDGLAVPRLLAADPAGELFGEAAVLISRVPGRGHITPADPHDWAARLGRGLARIHAVPVEGTAELTDAMAARTPPDDGPVADAWERLAGAPRALSHGDYWSGNTLWEGERLSAVVDWPHAALAPRGCDVAWCRDDMVLLHGEPVADTMLAAYEDEAGVTVPDMPLWDLWTADRTIGVVHTWSKGYVDLGRPDLTGEVLRERKSAWLARLMSGLAQVNSV